MTRRPAKGTSPRVRRRGNRTIVSRPFEPKIGRTYAVQPGRGKPARLRIEVTDVVEQLVGDITIEDARREGFRTVEDFKAYWVRLYDRDWLRRREQRVEDGTVVTVPLPLEELVARFDARHADTLVWAITFTPERQAAPRFLAARSDELYTSDERQALKAPDGEVEPEALDAGTLEAYARTARDRHEQFLADVAGETPLEDRIAALRADARRRGIDITRQLRSLEKHVQATERRVRRAA